MTTETETETETETDEVGATAVRVRLVTLRDGLGFRLSRVARGLRQGWAEDLHPIGTTPPQVAVLRGIAEEPGCSLRSLARVLGTDPTNTKRCVDELRQRGLLTSRDRTGDRRPLGLALTDAGDAFVRTVDQLVTAQEKRIADALGPAGCRGLAEALDQLERLLGLDGGAEDPDCDTQEEHDHHGGGATPTPWDARYTENDWPTEPDAALVERVEGLTPGTALDLGCGPGRNAVPLAVRGWRVTGVDASAVGLAQAHERARSAGVEIQTVQADLSDYLASAPPVDLVVLANIHVASEDRPSLLAAAARAVAPGGHLFVIGHHLDSLGRGGPPDPDRLYTEERLTDAFPGCTIEQMARRPRPHDGDGPPLVDLVVWAHREGRGA